MLKNHWNSQSNTLKTVFIILGGVILAVLVLFAAGFRISGWHLVKQSTLLIKNLPAETEVYVDNSLRGKFEGNAKVALTPGKHDIIISREGQWPYLEKIIVGKNNKDELTINPFLIPQSPDGKLIGTSEPEYKEAISLFNRSAVPLKETKLTSSNGKVSIYVDDGKIFAVNEVKDEAPLPLFEGDPNKEELEVFDPVTEVRNLAFYKDRDDVIIIAIQDGIFAIELDPAIVQNLQPIIEGDAPDFRISQGGKFYARDNNLLMLINL